MPIASDPTGLIYLINRYHDPATGQFPSVDPLASMTLSPYGYSSGDPISQTDPLGALTVCGTSIAPAGCQIDYKKGAALQE